MHGADVVDELGDRAQLLALEGEQLDGRFAGLAVDAHVGDGVEPLAGGRIEVAEVGDFEAGEEIFLDVADAGFDAALLVPGADVARGDLEAVMAGEVGVAGVEHRGLSTQALEHGRLEVVGHDPGGHSRAEVGEGVEVAAEEVFHGLGDGELEVHQAAVAQDHHEEAQPSPGVADIDAGVVPPVDLGGLAGGEVQGQERWRTHWAHPLEVVLHDGGAAVVADLAQAVQDLRATVGVVFEEAADIALERVELAWPRRGDSGPELGFVEPTAHGAHVERDGVGDLGGGELLGTVQMLDPLEGGVIDHVVLRSCSKTSLRRRGAALRGGGGSAGASRESTWYSGGSKAMRSAPMRAWRASRSCRWSRGRRAVSEASE